MSLGAPRLRTVGALACAAFLLGCSGPRASGAVASEVAADATASVRPAATAVRPQGLDPSPGPARPRPDLDCVPFDLSQQSQPYVVIPGEASRDEAYGLNGSGVLGSEAYDRGGWHQPSPGAAIPVERSARLRVRAFLDDRLSEPTCLSSMTAAAAPFSPLALAPNQDDLVHLPTTKSVGGMGAALEFAVPSDAGDWVVRVTLEFETKPGPSSQEAFFRLFVDVPAPIVDGDASSPIACGKLGGEHDPPNASISVDGGVWIEAARGSTSWRGTAGDGPPPNGPRVDAGGGARLRVGIEGDQCANWWRIELAPRPTGQLTYPYQEPITDLVPDAARSFYEPPGEANRFRLAEIPHGDWVVRAFFSFGRDSDHVIGSTSHFWNVVVAG